MKIRYFERGLSKTLEKVIFTQSRLMCKVIKNLRGLVAPQVTKHVKKNSFISYILSDQVWWCNIKQLLSYFKNYICKFMQTNSWHHKLFHFYLSFCIWRVSERREKITKIDYLENKKSFSDEIKNFCHSFSRAIICRKNKILIKNSRYKL